MWPLTLQDAEQKIEELKRELQKTRMQRVSIPPRSPPCPKSAYKSPLSETFRIHFPLPRT